MSPPVHIQIISALLNGVITVAGVRNLVEPGRPVVVIPEDDVFQKHFHGDPPTDPKMAWVFQLLGACFLMIAATKLICVFGQPEGTFLRQKLFAVLGVGDLVIATLAFSYKGMPPSVLGGFAVLHGLEGTAFLIDAVLRDRPVKVTKGKKK